METGEDTEVQGKTAQLDKCGVDFPLSIAVNNLSQRTILK